MVSGSMLIYATHGTYGRDDDAYGALLAANNALAKGFRVSLLLVEDGVCLAMSGQDPSRIGLPNNLDDLQDLMDLEGDLLVLRESMEERGIREEELIPEARTITLADLPGLIMTHDISLTF